MEITLAWLTAVGALVAAVASAATWWQTRTKVRWKVELSGGMIRLVNEGGRQARHVHARIGSAADASNVIRQEQVPVMRPDEVLLLPKIIPWQAGKDFALNVTWREGLFRRRGSWSYRLR